MKIAAYYKRIIIIFIVVLFSFFSETFAQTTTWLITGSYTDTLHTAGLRAFKYSFENKPVVQSDSLNIPNLSYLTISKNGDKIYAVSENYINGQASIKLVLFNKKTGRFTLKDEIETLGKHPVYIDLDSTEKWLAVAYYSSAEIDIIKIQDNDMLSDPWKTFPVFGKGVLDNRQASSHIHSVRFAPKNNFLLAADLGGDQVLRYNFQAKTLYDQPIPVKAPEVIKLSPGDGPRHFEFHPRKQSILYVLNELSGSVSLFNLDSSLTTARQKVASDTISPLPDKGSSQILASPDGKFLYTANRGNSNSFTIYKIDPQTDTLSLVATQSTFGLHPRHFSISKNGKYLAVANLKNNQAVLFSRNKLTGLLTKLPNKVFAPKVAVIQFVN